MLILCIVIIVLAGSCFLKYRHVIGREIPKEKRQTLNHSQNYYQGKFLNLVPAVMDMDAAKAFSILRDLVKGNPKSRPSKVIPVQPLDTAEIPPDKTRVTWFGHSTVLVETLGKRLLLDPVFSSTASPFSLFGSKRYSKQLPSTIENLPPIDAVLISHNHYDHLDYAAIKKLKAKVSCFYVPLGVGSLLEAWGVAKENIKEHDWWQETQLDGLLLAAVPAQHYSGRGLFDRCKTFWCSWVIKGSEDTIYFSGDSSYGGHFKEIGKRYGPFTLTLMECGQYDNRWIVNHMLPEQSVKAHQDLNGECMLPIHWAAFSLAFHNWTDPIERAVKAANTEQVTIITPEIGEAVIVGEEVANFSWWRQ